MAKERFGSMRYWLDEWIKPLLVAVILAMFIRTFVIQPFKIPSSSMEKTLQKGDRIFVNKFIYGARIPFTDIRLPEVREPQTGDVVVFLSPWEKKKYLVKRFIAEGPHTVEISHGRLLIDGKLVDMGIENLIYYNAPPYGAMGEPSRIPEGWFFALGDNSAHSDDSRQRGFVPKNNLVGKAFVIHWPISRAGIIK